ncbi:hypothetical protein DEO23_02770 [Brachybacterium endophyticum]|uniref:Uncharacterized protein n=1 Tax=Brachybacterium endophyticum TaxID=2182385 RepID=A0A2U2RNX9_9MICO|nr:hypothetical protein [Brachybacterium endophyticum]PWH07569.1 hypothetical protein DEO23_02770 [Brachybacterium endophyticum]
MISIPSLSANRTDTGPPSRRTVSKTSTLYFSSIVSVPYGRKFTKPSASSTFLALSSSIGPSS